MIPKKLYLKQFIGIRAGLNRDEITIDFEQLAGESQLIALVGENGAGKSTILDNSHPFRVMPSRAGGYSPGSFSYFDNIYGTEAGKELEWEHGGIRYRTTIVFKMPGKTKKQEAYLHRFNDDGWAPVAAADGMVSDGKTTTYDKVLESILGTPEMFFTSAFASQGRRPLASYGNGEIKGLLSELLGLDHVRELGDKAKTVSKQLTVRLDGMRSDIERVANAEHEHGIKSQELTGHQSNLEAQLQLRQRVRLDVSVTTRKLTELQAVDNNNTENEMRRNTLLTRQSSIESTLNKRITDINRDVINEQSRLEDARAFALNEFNAANKTITELKSNIARNQQTLDKKGEIESAQERVPELNIKLDAGMYNVDAKKAESALWSELVNKSAKLGERMKALMREGKAASDSVIELEARSKLVGEVPCAGTDMQCECNLLANATQARDKLPDVIADRDIKRDEYRAAKTQRVDVDKHVLSFGNIQDDIKKLEADLQRIQNEIAENNKMAALADTLSNTQESIKATESQIEGINARLLLNKEELSKTEQTVTPRVLELEDRKKSAQKEIEIERQTIKDELAALPDPADATVLTDAENAAEDADSRLSEIESSVENTNAQIARLEGEMHALSKSLTDSYYVKSLSATVEQEIAHWSMLAKAFSNDGIISLSIDDAGPTLASLTNGLLLACFGPRFSIRLDTQRETKTGGMKEAFEITVFDAERDDEKSVGSMSGGEKIWINEAMTRAIALYQADQSGQHYDCLFSDESDGALDPERKQQFMKMKRKVLELGGYQSEIFISHTPELQQMADVIIDMEGFRQ